MSTYSERYEEARTERVLAEQDEEKRALWRFCAATVARRSCCQYGAGHDHIDAYFGETQCPASLIDRRLCDALDQGDVPNLNLLIRKTQPDMMAFEESRMTPAERYRF